MESAADRPLTDFLRAWRSGDEEAGERLVPLVYGELRRLARRELQRERSGHTLESKELVHEAYMRLLDVDVPWEDRAHFFALAARTMRRILVDHARMKNRQKRGSGVTLLSLEHAEAVAGVRNPDVLMVDDALTRLGELDERMERIVELHFFGGLTYEEMATAVGVSPATVHRRLRLAKAWLRRELSGAPANA